MRGRNPRDSKSKYMKEGVRLEDFGLGVAGFRLRDGGLRGLGVLGFGRHY